MTDNEVVVMDPHVGQQFSSWVEAESHLFNYASTNHFVWSVDCSNSIEAENKKLAARNVPQEQWYNVALKYKNVTLCCMFGGRKRICSGKGVRPMQATFKTDCEVYVHLIARKNFIFIKDMNISQHNHVCNATTYQTLPKVRAQNLKDNTISSTCELLFKAGVKPCKVRVLMRGLGCGHVTQRDLQNFRQKLKRENLGGLSPEEKLTEVLHNILTEDPGTFIHIGKSEENELTFLYVQTSAMRMCMEKYGQILLLDHTYKVNKNRMPVTVLMTMDGHGDGRPVGYAFVANEQLATIKDVLMAFKESIGDDTASRVRSVTVDKDYTEISALKGVLPDAYIQLCDFHVSRTFKGKTQQEDPNVREILTALRYCMEDKVFDNLVEQLRSVASENFMKYFEKNWLLCPVAWSCRDRKKVPNLGNATNNRLESHNSKIKMMLNCTNELYEALQGLLEIVKNKEEDMTYRRVSEAVKQSYLTKYKDPIANTVVNDLTRFAASLILWELNEEPEEHEILKFKASEHECSCPHSCSFKDALPCRHTMACRRKAGIPVYDKNEIHSMFWKEPLSPISDGNITTDDSGGHVGSHVVPSKLMPHTHNERYTHSMIKAKMICSVLSECGDKQYSLRYSALEQLLQIWCAGKEVVICDSSDVSDAVVQGEQVQTNAPNPALQDVSSSVYETEIISLPATTRIDPATPDTVNAWSSIPTGATDKISPPNQSPIIPASSCIACINGDLPGGAHKCGMCQKNVHALPGCSIGASSDSDEGYGQSRTCIACAQGNEEPHHVIPVLNNLGPFTQTQAITQVPSKPVLCFCGEPPRRTFTSLSCQRPGRPILLCSLFKCKFRRYAKKEDADPTPDTVMPPLVSSMSTAATDVTCSRDDLSSLLDDENDSNLLALIELLDGMDSNDPSKDTNNGSLNSTPSERLKENMEGIKLPVKVKHKGRPQGLGRTVTKTFTNKSSKQSGAVCSKSWRPKGAQMAASTDGVQEREQRGLAIPDEHVRSNPNGCSWDIEAQSSKSGRYTVEQIMQANTCSCSVGICAHSFKCSCPDYLYRKLPCKHMYKIVAFVKEQGCQLKHGGSIIQSTDVSPCDAISDNVDEEEPPNQPQLLPYPSSNRNGTLSPDNALSGFPNNLSSAVSCVVCQLFAVGSGTLCHHCRKVVHVEECSIPHNSTKRLCRKCLCDLCKGVKDSSHMCECCVCQKSISETEGIICSKCERVAHRASCHKDVILEGSQSKPLCSSCLCSFGPLCTVCQRSMKTLSKCHICEVLVHDACSFGANARITQKTVSKQILCPNCYCQFCKSAQKQGHKCVCSVCSKLVSQEDGVICYRCNRLAHAASCSKVHFDPVKSAGELNICSCCLYTLITGITMHAMNELLNNQMLSDVHMSRASQMLSDHFSLQIDGLRTPLAVTFGDKIDTSNHYPAFTGVKDYVQLMSTGGQHWIVAIFRKGSPTVITILDSLRQRPLTGHVKLQLAMIAHTSEDQFTVIRPPIKQQRNGIDCGLFAIANATEYCYSSSLKYLDFDESMLRSHWKDCIESKQLTPFPKRSNRSKKIKEEDDITVIKVYCLCRMPDSYGNLIACDVCEKWFHKVCVQVLESFTGDWLCDVCKNNYCS